MIKPMEKEDISAAVKLAWQLWPNHTAEELLSELETIWHDKEAVVFLSVEEANNYQGFAQCSLRHDYVEGTSTTPVGYLEGIFVQENERMKGIARRLVKACQWWARGRGCQEFASDCTWDNEVSQQFHLKMGFEEAGRIVCFRKELTTAGILLLPYQESDLAAITALFYDTVHQVNCQDYTEEQLAAWAPEEIDWERWRESLAAHYTIVAKQNNQVVGFGDIDDEGYLDRLFIHKDFQRQGIAAAILEHLEEYAGLKGAIKISADVSLTAKRFFLHKGYHVCQEQQVVRKGVTLVNFKMEKLLS